MSKKNYQVLIKEAFRLLLNVEGYEGDYSQKEVVAMLETVGFDISKSAITILKKAIESNQKIDTKRAKKYGVPLEQVVKNMLGLEFDAKTSSFLPMSDTNWTPINLLDNSKGTPKNTESSVLQITGRWSPSQKVDFFSNTQKELIEYGVKLENFASYFEKFGNHIYQKHIVDLLEKGVTVKYFMLEPKSNAAIQYFEDRAKFDPSEKEALNKLPDILEKIINIAKRLNAKKYKGRFEIYTYKNFPTNHFIAIDTNTPKAKMMVSLYVYGIARAKAPLLIFSKKDQPELYELYHTSLNALVSQAKCQYPPK